MKMMEGIVKKCDMENFTGCQVANVVSSTGLFPGECCILGPVCVYQWSGGAARHALPHGLLW